MKKGEDYNRTLIYDYALEPELVTDCDESLYKYLKYKKFGWDTGCIVVKYPVTWWKRVEELFKDRRKFELLLELLSKTQFVAYYSRYDNTISWFENAEKAPFHMILAHDNPQNQSNVVCGADISSGAADRAWDQPPPSITINRTATSMAICIEPMLRYATKIRFIDPYFCASHERYQKAFM